jgi:hypothetical protein
LAGRWAADGMKSMSISSCGNYRTEPRTFFTIVQSMANQVARQTDNFDDFRVGFSRRLGAFAETHDLLVMERLGTASTTPCTL